MYNLYTWFFSRSRPEAPGKSQDISGSPFSPELDVNDILPDVTREQHKALKSVRRRWGPVGDPLGTSWNGGVNLW